MLQGLIKKVFGDKNEKAIKDIWPVVDEINQEYSKLQNLTDDELRAKTKVFKEKIENETADIRNKLDDLKTKLRADELDEDRSQIYDEIDKLEIDLDEKYEEILTEILPEAFAVIKDTCRRLVGQTCWTVMGCCWY